jgi:hypothetical protein
MLLINRHILKSNILVRIKINLGKNYVKKVFDNIRETLPRLIGQNLLK